MGSIRENNVLIREASSADIIHIHALLTQVGLGVEDILAERTRYWLAVNENDRVIGVAGLELGLAEAVLLRSVAVSPELQGRGIGGYLMQTILEFAAASGYRQIYLFSTDAGTYWQRQGFHEVPVNELVAALPAAPQVRRYETLGWLPSEVAWRRDVSQ